MCVLVQVESVAELEQLPQIAAVDGVDGVSFGSAEMSASMGLRGQPGHANVQQAAGVLSADKTLATRYLDAGATFVAVGVDSTLTVRAATELCASTSIRKTWRSS